MHATRVNGICPKCGREVLSSRIVSKRLLESPYLGIAVKTCYHHGTKLSRFGFWVMDCCYMTDETLINYDDAMKGKDSRFRGFIEEVREHLEQEAAWAVVHKTQTVTIPAKEKR